MDVAEHLASVGFFRGLAPAQLTALARIIVRKDYARGQTIFVEGEEANGFYLLISGRVKVYKLSPEGKEQILHFFGPGEPFGEAAVFSGLRFPAFSESLEASSVYFIPRQAFIDQLRLDPSLAMIMLAELSRKLRRFANLIEDLSLREVPGRLAAYLLYLRDRQGTQDAVTLDISKTQLAALLGTIPETLSRILNRMGKEGFIETAEGRTIGLLDLESLEELANGERRLGGAS